MAYFNDYRTPSNPTNFPPIPVAAGTLSNFTVAPALPFMPDLSVTKKYLPFRWTGPNLTLNLTNAPWLSKVLKIVGFTAPGTGGANAQTAYLGAANGQTPGGTLRTLVNGDVYQLVAAATDGWALPTAAEVLRPAISSLNPLSVTAGDTLNITGTNLLTTQYVLIGGALALITSAATTSTNVAVTVPLTAPSGNNIAVTVISETGNMAASTLTVAATTNKLAKPVLNAATNITSSGFTITWTAIPGANSYRVRLNNSTLFMQGNATSYSFSNLPAGTQATADVQAIDSTGAKTDSDYSAPVTVTTSAAVTSIYNLTAEGDSRTAPANRNGYDPNWFSALQQRLNGQSQYIGFSNLATGGDTVAQGPVSIQMSSASEKAEVLATKNTTAGVKNLLWIAAPINDLQYGATPQQAFNDFKALHAYYQGQGYTTAAALMLNSLNPNSPAQPAFWQAVQTFNNLCRTEWNNGGLCTVLEDLQTDPNLGGYSAPNNSNYFLLDKIHIAPAGTDSWADFSFRGLPFLAAGTRKVINFGGVANIATLETIGNAPPPPAALATPVILDAANPNNSSITWADSGTGQQNARFHNAPALVQNAMSGKAAYLFPRDGVLRYAELPALAGSANAYTITAYLQSIADNISQFYFACDTGVIVASINGFSNLDIGPGAYYANTQSSQATGARGNNITAELPTVITIALGTDNGVVYIDGVRHGTYPVSITRLSGPIRIGAGTGITDAKAASDYTTSPVTQEGLFFGYLQYFEVAPGKYTDQQAMDKYTAITGGSTAPPITTLTYTGDAKAVYTPATKRYSTTSTSGNWDTLISGDKSFPASGDAVVLLHPSTQDDSVIICFSESAIPPATPADVKWGIFLVGGLLRKAESGTYTSYGAIPPSGRIMLHRAKSGTITIETATGIPVTFGTTSTAKLYTHALILGQAGAGFSFPSQVGGI